MPAATTAKPPLVYVACALTTLFCRHPDTLQHRPRHSNRCVGQTFTFDLSTGPNRIILYQKNIEAVCSSEAEIRHEVRQTVLHELGHYFGMDEAQLKDV